MGKSQKIRVLFVCTRNSCRSQMAEGWAKKLQPNLIEAESAGIEKHEVDPLAIKVMAEAGVDISNQKSKLIDDVDLNAFDYVITLCDEAEKRCPYIPGNIKRLHLPVDDPQKFKTAKEEDIILNYRRIRNEIRHLVMHFPIAKINRQPPHNSA